MNLTDKYEAIFRAAKPKIQTEEAHYDHLIGDKEDRRRGITLLMRPNRVVVDKIKEVLSDFEKIEPEQYYYPDTDMHVTGLSIISCYPEFDLESISIPEYIAVIAGSLKGIPPFTLTFDGLTASLDGVMVKGFYAPQTLDDVRDKLRKNFLATSLQQSLDQRYLLETAHATVMRLSAPLKNKQAYIELIEAYSDYDFGSFLVDELELVYNDWYQQSDKVNVLHRFKLDVQEVV